MDTNELLYHTETPHNIAKHLIVPKRVRWWAVSNKQVEMNIHTTLYEIHTYTLFFMK